MKSFCSLRNDSSFFAPLNSVIFPKGTFGKQLDCLARMPLWSYGKDYKHGTGHGVGAFLNVHEGPQYISHRDSIVKASLEPGMTITIEPGYYEDGNFGIRIENVAIVVPVETEYKFDGLDYFGFESITLVPLQVKLIDQSLLSVVEMKWIDNYHKRCFKSIAPLLSGEALQWLKRETEPLCGK